MAEQFETVDEYIATCPAEVRPILEQIRETIRTTAPTTGETIKYKMPTVTLDGKALFYFAAWKHHIGIYPIPRLDDELEARVAPLRAAKDTVQLKLKDPMPYDLIANLTEVLVQNREHHG